jgi:hypothetical protein
VLRIDRIPALHAESTVTAAVEFAPAAPGEVVVALRAADGARITGARATLLDGTPLAAKLQRGTTGAHFSLGHLEVPVLLSVTMRADVPVTTSSASLTVEVGGEAQTAPIALVGEPKFLAARSRLRLSRSESAPAGDLTLTIAGTNDGTAVAQDVRLHLEVPQNITMDAGSASWREVNAAGERSIVIPIERVDVGDRFVREVKVKVAPVSPDGREVSFTGWIAIGEVRFDLEPVMLVVRSAARAAAKLKIIESRTYRYGDRVMGVLSVKARGTDVVRDVVVRVSSQGIAWAGADDDNALAVPFGTLPPFAEASRLIEGVVIAAPSAEQSVSIPLEGFASGGSVQADGASIKVAGASRVLADLTVGAADEAQAHAVRLFLRNTGDGVATSVRVAAVALPGVVGVVDSLTVEGQARFALDGSLAVERDGFDAGPLGIAEERTIAWKIRAASAQSVPVAVKVTIDGATVVAEAVADLVGGVRADALLPAATVAPVDATTSFDAPERAAAVAQPEGETAAAGDEAVAAASAQAAEQEETPAEPPSDDAALSVRYAISAIAAARWSAWFGQDGPSAATPLGMHVLAVREFLPVGASNTGADAALAGIRSESEAVVSARLESYKVCDVFGASGFDFGTPRLRSAVATVLTMLGRDTEDLEGVGLDRALVAMTGASGTALADVVEQYRDALGLVLADVDDVARFGEECPEMLAPARALFEALVMAVAA